MKVAYFDCSYGLAGDMILGALVDAGAPFDKLKHSLEEGLGIEGIRLERTEATRAGVSATRVLVHTDAAHEHHRHLSHIEEIINGSSLSQTVKDRALTAFRRLAEAEAKVHHSTPEQIHFHEVGCLDAIADVTGAMLALEMLGVDRVVSSPVTVGRGETHCAHGVIPVPAPATIEILRGAPTVGSSFEMEMTTPTGAAIITTIATEFGRQPLMSIEQIGYGAAERELEGRANFLRVFLGTAAGEGEKTSAHSEHAHKHGYAHAHPEHDPAHAMPHARHDRLSVLTTEVDDMNPELLGALMDSLFSAGARDAHFAPIQMKKNRPGVHIQVLCDCDKQSVLTEKILRETTTFGVKAMEVDRFCLGRRRESVSTKVGPVDVKVGLWGDSVLKVKPEHESCRKAAESSGLPPARVYQMVEAEIEKQHFAG